ncbi:MAG: LytTR family transcriptional regulator [Gammaproteobacteria bacterium]|nr:LytTR family transcriptional regulator [Gammaproteobacteria bacterium]
MMGAARIAASEIWYLRAGHEIHHARHSCEHVPPQFEPEQIKENLDPDVFWQIDRSIIVNVGAIETIHRSFRGALELKLKERTELLPVSSPHAQLFRQF